jgi:hypothetical protein
MVGELEIIFHVHPVAGRLGVARHILVLFQKLGGVAPGAIVDAIAIVAPAPIAAIGTSAIIVPTAIAPAGLPVVDQDMVLAFTCVSITENTDSVHPRASVRHRRPGKAPQDIGFHETHAHDLPEASPQRRHDSEERLKAAFPAWPVLAR